MRNTSNKGQSDLLNFNTPEEKANTVTPNLNSNMKPTQSLTLVSKKGGFTLKGHFTMMYIKIKHVSKLHTFLMFSQLLFVISFNNMLYATYFYASLIINCSCMTTLLSLHVGRAHLED